MPWFIVENNTLINRIVYDGVSHFELPEGQELINLAPEDGAEVGWKYLNGEVKPAEWSIENGLWVEPPPPPPPEPEPEQEPPVVI